jgi:hypothetical protein
MLTAPLFFDQSGAVHLSKCHSDQSPLTSNTMFTQLAAVDEFRHLALRNKRMRNPIFGFSWEVRPVRQAEDQ